MRRCCIIYNEPRENALADELDVLDQVAHIEQHMNELGVKFGPPPQQSALSNYTEQPKKEEENGNGHDSGNGAPRGVQLTGACPLCGGPLRPLPT